MPNGASVSIATLKQFQPIGSLSDLRLAELAALCYVERVPKEADPFHDQPITGKSVYLLRGELALWQADGAQTMIIGGSEEACSPIGRRRPFTSARAITDIELIRLDDDLIDIMLTWDQLAAVEITSPPPPERKRSGAQRAEGGDWRLMTGMFSLKNLQFGAISRLPSAHIGKLLGRFERVEIKRGVVVIREGDDGDCYYVIENGRAQVTRKVGGVEMKLAQLKAGDAFGEEALLSEGKRNATVTMLADGVLLRLSKAHFDELLKKPLLKEIGLTEASEKVTAGAQWVDVRYPSEFQYDKLSGAMNIPLSEIRNAAGILDLDREYVIYCQTGRRSSAAAFLLAQRGFQAFVLDGGLAKSATSAKSAA